MNRVNISRGIVIKEKIIRQTDPEYSHLFGAKRSNAERPTFYQLTISFKDEQGKNKRVDYYTPDRGLFDKILHRSLVWFKSEEPIINGTSIVEIHPVRDTYHSVVVYS